MSFCLGCLVANSGAALLRIGGGETTVCGLPTKRKRRKHQRTVFVGQCGEDEVLLSLSLSLGR